MFEYTNEQLAGWKKKYGEDGIYEVVVDDKKAILHKPSRKDISYATSGSSSGQDAMKFNEILMRQCWVDGDREILEDDDYFFGAVPTLQAILEVKKAEIKKL